MNELTGMHGHFAKVAGVYRELRTTDEEPILHIRDHLAGRPAVTAADIGCGAGRYDLLLFRHLPNLCLACLDVSRARHVLGWQAAVPFELGIAKTVASLRPDAGASVPTGEAGLQP